MEEIKAMLQEILDKQKEQDKDLAKIYDLVDQIDNRV
jgi:hypothetical protein